MARSYVEIIKDDLSGEVIEDGTAETIEFTVNGKSYSIDLGMQNAAEFHQSLDKYIAVAAKVAPPARKIGRPGTGRSDKEQLSAIRAWAKVNGYDISSRGRISAEVLTAYDNR